VLGYNSIIKHLNIKIAHDVFEMIITKYLSTYLY